MPAPRPAQLPLAEGALGQPEQRPRCQQRQLAAAAAARCTLCAPSGEVLGTGEVVEVQDQRQPPFGQVARHGRGRRELVDRHVARRRMLGIHPMLEGLGGQVVVDRLGEDLRAPPGRPQGGAELQRVGRRGVMRVEAGDELVHGHRPPGGSAHRSAAVRRGDGVPDREDEEVAALRARQCVGLVPALPQQAAPGLGPHGRPAARSASGGASAASQACRVTECTTSVPPGASRVPMAPSSWLRSPPPIPSTVPLSTTAPRRPRPRRGGAPPLPRPAGRAGRASRRRSDGTGDRRRRRHRRPR